LETKLISGLYFAGQVNAPLDTEEAAAQGLIAGSERCFEGSSSSTIYPG